MPVLPLSAASLCGLHAQFHADTVLGVLIPHVAYAGAEVLHRKMLAFMMRQKVLFFLHFFVVPRQR